MHLLEYEIFHSSELDPIKRVHSVQHSIQSKFPSSGHLVTTMSFGRETFIKRSYLVIK